MAVSKKFRNKLIFLPILFIGIFFLGSYVHADSSIGTTMGEFVGAIIGLIISALGLILILVMKGLVLIATYQNFIGAQAVVLGWVIVRDVCNMFFVVVLLIIAFGTILHLENYSYKKWLPKLILMAILINFSKTICGLLIDVAQVVMLTFVNAFKDVAGGNLVDILGITDIVTMAKQSNDSGFWTIVGAYFLGLIYLIIALIVIVTMMMMLVMRLVMIWIYVVLSPLAYLLSAFPGGEKYAAQWWSEFTKNLIVGPVLAFFIWLSFAALQTGNAVDVSQIAGSSSITTETSALTSSSGLTNDANTAVAGSQSSTPSALIKFVIAIGMLIGGLKIAQEIGGAAGSMAGSGMAALNKGKGMAMGGLGAVSGYNFAKRRFGSWQEEQKKKVQQKSDLIYENIKGGAIGSFKGAKNVVKKSVSDRMDYVSKNTKAGRWVNENIVSKPSNFIQSRKQEHKERQLRDKARYEAYDTGVYEDKTGNKYEYQELKNARGQVTASHYVDDKGRIATEDGKVLQYDKNRDQYLDEKGNAVNRGDAQVVKKMSAGAVGMRDGLMSGLTKAKALRNQINDERAAKKQKLFEDAGVSTSQLKRIITDSGSSQDKKLGAIMQLAIKDGFKNKDHQAGRELVGKSKEVIGNNAPLLKKFEESLNKRFAHLNYNLDTEGGRNKYKQAMDEGRFDGYSQDSTAYDNAATIKTLKDYSGVDFADNISRTASKSNAHRETVGSGVLNARNEELSSGKPLYDEATGELNAFSKILARVNGDLAGAFNSSADKSKMNFNDDSVKAVTQYLNTAKASWLSNINTDLLKVKGVSDMMAKSNVSNQSGQPFTADDAKEMVEKMQQAVSQGLEVNKIVSMQRNDQSPEFVKRAIGIKNTYGPSKDKDDIDDNNVIKSIKPIEPEVPKP